MTNKEKKREKILKTRNSKFTIYTKKHMHIYLRKFREREKNCEKKLQTHTRK